MLMLPLAVFFGGPFSVLATAAGAVSVPIIIHLLNRKRFRVVTWAAMRFLIAAQKKNSRRLRIEQLVLLAVRALVVLLLILAMASVTDWAERLWARHLPAGTLISNPGGNRTHRILVLDGSLSMGLRAGDTNCFEKARALAARLVRESPRGDGFSVVLMASSPRRIVGGVAGPAEDPNKVVAELEAIRLPHGNSDLAGTLETVFDLLRQSPGKFVDKEVYFITDLQKTTWLLPQPGQVASVLQGVQSRARTILLDVGEKETPPNLAVTRLVLAPDLPVATSRRTTTFISTVHNYGPETPGEVRVTLRVGRAARKGETFAEMRWDEVPRQTRLVRGQNTISFPYVFPDPGDYVVQVRLEADALDLDDTRNVVVRVRDRVPVLLVNGKPAADLYDQATEYVFDALNPFQDGPAPRTDPIRPRKLSAADFDDAGLGDLTRYDCVFLCDLPRLSTSEAKRLESHVLRGGGLVIALGPSSLQGLNSYNDLLYKGGKGLLPARLLGRQPAPKGYFFHFMGEDHAFKRPPLLAFSLERDRSRLLSAPFHEFVRTEMPPASAVPLLPRKVLSFVARAERADQPKSADPAAYLREPAVIEWQPALPPIAPGSNPGEERGRMPAAPANRGRVVLLTSTVNTDWTGWPRQGNFVWFMQELLAHAAAGRLREQATTVGDTIEEYLPGGINVEGQEGKEVTVQTPDGRREKTRTVARDDAVLWRWSDTDVSGVYRAVIGSSPEERLLAVNVPADTDDQRATESDLTRVGTEELQKTYPEWDIQVVRDPGEAVHDGKASGAGVEVQRQKVGSAIARWLLLLVLALLIAEVILAWYFGHYTAVHERDRAPHGWSRGRFAIYLRVGLNVSMVILLAFSLATGVVLIHAAWTGDLLGFLPEGTRSTLEASLGVPPPAPGEGSRWNLEFRPYLWDGSADLWLAPLLGVALGALVIGVYRRESRVAAPGPEEGGPLHRRRGARLLLLCGLRLGLFLLMLAVLMPQLRLWFERQSWPDVVIILDESASMAEADDFRDPKVREAAERLAQIGGLDHKERLKLAQTLVARPDGDWLTAMLEKHQAKVHVYRCSGRAARVASVTRPEEIKAALEGVRGLEASKEHDSSQLGAAVRQVLNDFRGASLAAVVMLTDGVTTEGEDLAGVAKYAAQMKVPLFFVGIGDAQESRDLIISDLEVADSVFVNDNLIFRANLTVKGYGERPGPVKVRLHEKGSNKELASQIVTPEASGRPAKVRLEHRPDKAGPKVYVVEAEVRPDEVDKDNNRLEKDVFVSETRMIKVLYVEGYGRWEFRYLKTLLERESARKKNNKTMDLSVVLLEADPEFHKQDRSAGKLRGELPTKAELGQYDVVILGDVDPNPPRDGDRMGQFLRDLADFVRERGGGLLMLAGERYAPHAYKDSPLRDVLPIDITREQPPDEPEAGRTEGFRPELTPVGRMHPIFSFNEKDNEAVWAKLREMYWYAEGYVPKRAAEVLVVHPTAKGQGKEAKHPLVVQQFVGAGRALIYGFHETWRWRWREDEGRYNQFWIQTVRYLARSRQGRVELRLDRQTPYQRGEPIKITVRFPDDAPAPPAETDVRVAVLNRDLQERRTIKLTRTDGSRGTFEGILTRTPVGRYEFWLAQPRVADPQPRAECKVVAPPGETQQIRMNQSEMEQAARETSGQFYSLSEADKLLDELPSGSRVTLNAPGPPWLVWNHALLFLIALLFLSTEWLLRKRYHLL
jgi:uncharacterized membrane protein